MKTATGVKREVIAHLEYCLETLPYKDNGYNELVIMYLYKHIYRVICEMKCQDDISAISYFHEHIDDKTRKLLQDVGIELVV